MPRRPCSVTQSAIARAIRAAQQTGARIVKIEPDGNILIDPAPDHGENPQLAKERVAESGESVLW